jgi:hypothetical protein
MLPYEGIPNSEIKDIKFGGDHLLLLTNANILYA